MPAGKLSPAQAEVLRRMAAGETLRRMWPNPRRVIDGWAKAPYTKVPSATVEALRARGLIALPSARMGGISAEYTLTEAGRHAVEARAANGAANEEADHG